MTSKCVVSLALSLAGLAGVSCSNGGDVRPVTSGSSNPNAVTIKGFLFRPEVLTVVAGTAVTWTNRDDIAHTVTAGMPGKSPGRFDSGDVALGQMFTHTFGTSGTFAYFCSNHNSMRGQVTVT